MEVLCQDKKGRDICPGATLELMVPVKRGKRRINRNKQLAGKAVCFIADNLFMETTLKGGQAVFYACQPSKVQVKVIRDPETDSK